MYAVSVCVLILRALLQQRWEREEKKKLDVNDDRVDDDVMISIT